MGSVEEGKQPHAQHSIYGERTVEIGLAYELLARVPLVCGTHIRSFSFFR